MSTTQVDYFPKAERALFDAEWARLECEWGQHGTDWADHLLTRAKTPRGGYAPGCGNWGSLALDLESNRTMIEPYDSDFHQRAHMDLAFEIEHEIYGRFDNPESEARWRVADFRIALVDGYSVPWAICADISRGRKHPRANLRDWFLGERVALPLFWLQFQSMPEEIRVGFGLT